jgi:IclR family transcriptional regulator, KDG regulon repressor
LLGSIGKAGRVLDLFTPQHPEWGVTEVAAALSMPRSSAYDLLSTLAETGLLKHSDCKRYRLGWKVVSMSRTVLSTSDVRTHAQEVMRALVERLGATVHLATFDNGEVICIDKLASCQRLPLPASAIGMQLPPHSSAVGKVLLAHQPRLVATRAFERSGMPRYTQSTTTSVDALSFELASIRDGAPARDREETIEGVCCHAAPILNCATVVAAISVSVTSEADARFPERLAAIAKAAGMRVSQRIRAAESMRASHALAG